MFTVLHLTFSGKYHIVYTTMVKLTKQGREVLVVAASVVGGRGGSKVGRSERWAQRQAGLPGITLHHHTCLAYRTPHLPLLTTSYTSTLSLPSSTHGHTSFIMSTIKILIKKFPLWTTKCAQLYLTSRLWHRMREGQYRTMKLTPNSHKLVQGTSYSLKISSITNGSCSQEY